MVSQPSFRCGRLCGAALLAIFTLVHATAGAAERWIEVSSSHLNLVSDAESERAEEIVLALEKLRRVLVELLPHQTLSSPIPTGLYAFRDRKELAYFLPK